MIHHSSTDYAIAASHAAKVGREKMQAIIDNGRISAEEVIREIQDRVVVDKVVHADAVEIMPSGVKWLIGNKGMKDDQDAYGELHGHALDQILTNTKVGKTFYNEFAGEIEEGEASGAGWGNRLIQENVNTILSHRHKQRNLVRKEKGVVKGWLSDSYKRLDSRPILDSFIGAIQQMGMLPIGGVSSDTKCRLRAVLPEVFEPIDNEVMIFGLEWGNSDYGDAGHVVNLWMMRVYCTNLAITEKCMRQIHLGKPLEENIQWSEKTYQLDTDLAASRVRDIARSSIGPEKINRVLEAVKKCSEEEIKGKDVEAVLKKHFDKLDVERIKTAFDSHDNQNMPAGQTKWRLSNAISWLAQSDKMSADKRMDYENVAGILVGQKTAKNLDA